MNDFLNNAAGGVKDWLISSVCYWIQWLFGSIYQLIGLPGLIGIGAACLLMIPVSTKTLKFLHSPKGMTLCAATALIGIGLSWWMWPKAAAAPDRVSARNDSGTTGWAQKSLPGLQMPSNAPMEASKADPAAGASLRASKAAPLAFPPLVMDLPPAAVATLPPATVFVPHGPPVIVLPHHQSATHHAASPQHHSTTEARKPTAAPAPVAKAKPAPARSPAAPPATVAKAPAAKAPNPSAKTARKPAATPGPVVTARPAPVQRPATRPSPMMGQSHNRQNPAAARRAAADREFTAMWNVLERQYFGGGGMHPSAGMHPMGGMGHASGHHTGHR